MLFWSYRRLIGALCVFLLQSGIRVMYYYVFEYGATGYIVVVDTISLHVCRYTSALCVCLSSCVSLSANVMDVSIALSMLFV